MIHQLNPSDDLGNLQEVIGFAQVTCAYGQLSVDTSTCAAEAARGGVARRWVGKRWWILEEGWLSMDGWFMFVVNNGY